MIVVLSAMEEVRRNEGSYRLIRLLAVRPFFHCLHRLSRISSISLRSHAALERHYLL